MKYTYKKMASGGKVGKGYTAKERKGLRKLIEEVADPYAGDVTGGSSVTVVKKKVKKMARGGDVSIGRRGGDVGAGRRGGGGGMGFKATTMRDEGIGKGGGFRPTTIRGYKAGGIVGAPARSHKDMRAGAGSGVGRIQKTKIQRGR